MNVRCINQGCEEGRREEKLRHEENISCVLLHLHCSWLIIYYLSYLLTYEALQPRVGLDLHRISPQLSMEFPIELLTPIAIKSSTSWIHLFHGSSLFLTPNIFPSTSLFGIRPSSIYLTKPSLVNLLILINRTILPFLKIFLGLGVLVL